MRLLVTGASGFIGRALVARLAQHHSLVLVVRPGSAVSIAPHQGAVLEWDLVDPPPALPDHLDAVVHLAQSRNHRHFPDAAPDMLDVNVVATVRLAAHAVRAKARLFCLVSSGSVYEPCQEMLVESSSRLAPATFYGASKLAAEQLLAPYRSHMAVFIPRLFNPYGPGQTDRLVSNLIDRVSNQLPVQVDADGGGPWISPIYCDDVANILGTAIGEGWDGVYNVGGNEVVSLRDLATAIGRVLDTPPRFLEVERPPVRMVPNLDRLRHRYPLDTLVNLESGLRSTVNAHLTAP